LNKLQYFVVCAIFVALCLGCLKRPNQFIRRFDVNQSDIEALYDLIKKTNRAIGVYYRHEFSAEIETLLKKMDIGKVDIQYSTCDGVQEYAFETEWSKRVVVYLTKDKCRKERAEKGRKYERTEMITEYGLGNDWVMLIDEDFY
jgi:hypothetical protein